MMYPDYMPFMSTEIWMRAHEQRPAFRHRREYTRAFGGRIELAPYTAVSTADSFARCFDDGTVHVWGRL